jgi:hypothetical protein
MKLDRRLRGDLGQLGGRESVERGSLREKPRDLAQAGVQLVLSRPVAFMGLQP